MSGPVGSVPMPAPYIPAHSTSYGGRPCIFTAPCPSCGADCEWLASAAAGTTPCCPCGDTT